jgi:hypothetical protein
VVEFKLGSTGDKDVGPYRWSVLCKAGKEFFRRLVPFCFPMPSLFSTSRTSPGLGVVTRFLDLDRLRVGFASPPNWDEEWSRVEMDGAAINAGFDTLLRPSRASLSSVTPTPLVDRAKLWRERFSMCINAGDIFRRGEILSPRNVSKFED